MSCRRLPALRSKTHRRSDAIRRVPQIAAKDRSPSSGEDPSEASDGVPKPPAPETGGLSHEAFRGSEAPKRLQRIERFDTARHDSDATRGRKQELAGAGEPEAVRPLRKA